MKLPRIMLAGVSSGSGKTLITCGILQALVNRGLTVTSFKCGPDYIDPMFHSRVIGTKSRNLDPFFTEEATLNYLLAKTGKGSDLALMEGVMGYYDGLGGISSKASSYDVAKITDTPVILVVNCKGMSVSVLPLIQGFLQYEKNSKIQGVILNQMAGVIYPEIKKQIEERLSVKVFGYVPFVKELTIESRHLGLVTPGEIKNLQEKLNGLAKVLEDSLDIDRILELSKDCSELEFSPPVIPKVEGEPVIAVARDEAFCFYYEDNLELLKEMGARLIEFSPLYDKQLPRGAQGLILGGGYPELFAETLSSNKSMRSDIKKALQKGLPCLAECGGFMYLHNQMEDMEGKTYPMVGIIDGNIFKTSRLGRFGYIELTAKKNQMIAEQGDQILGHEFHYFDSSNCGEDFRAVKPLRGTSWECIHGKETLAAGFPHLYYYSNTRVPYSFLNKCTKFRGEEEIQ